MRMLTESERRVDFLNNRAGHLSTMREITERQ